MELDRLVEALAPRRVVNPAAVTVAQLAYDAREVRPGALFFCVRGARADGHDFAAEALARGAVALVAERPLDVPAPQLIVASVREAMPRAAVEFFGDPSRELVVAGVTGTNGKTTTAFLLASVLEAAGLRPGLLGNIERRVGAERRPAALNTPESIDLQRTLREMIAAGNRTCVLEASSHASAKHRLDGVRFSSLAFTNLSRDHLDFHAGMEDYFAAKRRLFLDGRPPAAVNVGDPWGRRLADELRADGRQTLLTFGAADADLQVDEAFLGPDGGRLRIGSLWLRTRLRGSFNSENVLAAVASARLLGIADEPIAAGVERLESVPGRLEPVDEGQPFGVFVDYAHTADSLAAVLRSLREIAGGGRIVCVFGAGGDRDRGKRPEMGRVADALADVVIVTSDNPRGEDLEAIADEVAAGAVRPPAVVLDRREAIARALDVARPGDTVLIAGKGHETGQEIGGVVHPFDDREVARAALRALAVRT